MNENVNRPFVCGWCNLNFFNSTDLERHVFEHLQKPCKIEPIFSNQLQSTQNQAQSSLLNSTSTTSKLLTSTPGGSASQRSLQNVNNESNKNYVMKIPQIPAALYSNNTLTFQIQYQREDIQHSRRELNEQSHATIQLPQSYVQDLKLLPRDQIYPSVSKIPQDLFIQTIKTEPRDFKMDDSGTEGSLSCQYCHKKFKFEPNLKRHSLVHTKEKPFSCKVCHKDFNQMANLKRHNLTHTKEQKFICNICNRRFSQLCNLKRHCIKVHTKEK